MNIFAPVLMSLWLLPASSEVLLPIDANSLLPAFTSSNLSKERTPQSAITVVQTSNYTEAEAEIVQWLDLGQLAYIDADDALSSSHYEQAIALIDELESANEKIDIWLKGEALYGFGRAQGQLQNYEKALPALETALEIIKNNPAGAERREIPHAPIMLNLYGMLGAIAQDTGGYATALQYYRPALEIAKAEGFPDGVAILRHDIGAIEADIGQYEQAQISLSEAIELSNQVGLHDLEAIATFTLGWLAEQTADLDSAIARYQASIDLFSSLRQSKPIDSTDSDEPPEQKRDLTSREVRAYNNLGIVHLKQRNTSAAKQAFEQGFELLKQHNDPFERALLLDSVGSVFKAEGDIEQAWTKYLQGWQLSRQSNDPVSEMAVLLNLGALMEEEAEPALAIFFYKQAIARIEAIRTDLKQLPLAVQQRYTENVEDAYRTLASLLLQQGREAEALEVLDLLKLQEAEAYLHQEGAARETGAQTFNNEAEARLLVVLENFSGNTSLADFVVHPAVIALKTFNHSQSDESAFDLQAVTALKDAIAQQPSSTAALYPLILEDRLEMLLLTPAGSVERFTTEVSREQLSEAVSDLQQALRNKAVDARPEAEQLHEWMIEPLREVLEAEGIETIIYLPDSFLRYVPLAAFHDGDRWLAETYQSHTITAAAIDDLTGTSDRTLGVTAGAFTDSSIVHRVPVGDRAFTYSGLSAAQQEVDNLLTALPNSAVLLNQSFSPERLLAKVDDHPILHLATHAQFIPGQPEDSFILFGDGRTVDLHGLQRWRLPDVDLVVLSACQTASSADGEGKEILGLGYQIRGTGAKAAIASLWSVDDTATAALMSQFYQHLSAGHSKAEALKLAQVDLMNTPGFDNPYDWAGFILIGNGL